MSFEETSTDEALVAAANAGDRDHPESRSWTRIAVDELRDRLRPARAPSPVVDRTRLRRHDPLDLGLGWNR